MTYQLTDDLITANVTIDGEHREIFDILNQLFIEYRRGEGYIRLFLTMHFLEQYFTVHFEHEEELMDRAEHPDPMPHRKLHRERLEIIHQITQDLFYLGSSPAIMERVKTEVGDWLISHAKHEDAQLAAYIRRLCEQGRKKVYFWSKN